ncbi:hypothetical protein [Streptomyces sp. NPDC089915]|uniref:hypothetical protein n=1 Tax=Streptomyces sp. NPDC089915 TaxID=3155186 RepID=UPI00343AED6D
MLPRQADRRRPGSTAVAHHAARPKPGPGGRRPPHRRPALLLGAAGLLGLGVRTLNRRRGGNPDR